MGGVRDIIPKIPAREWKGLTPTWEGGRLLVPLTCHRCGNTDHWSASQMIGPQNVIPKIIQIGWGVDGKVTCPACLHVKGKRGTINDNDATQRSWRDMADKVVKLASSAPAAGEATEAAKKAKRLVYAALEDYYDDVGKRDRDGHSDTGIAKELGVAEAFVAKIRSEDFGPIGLPAGVDELASEIAELNSKADALQHKLNQLIQRNGWKA